MALGVVILAYLAYGIAQYFGGWSGGAAKTISSIFFYPAGSAIVPGYLGYYLLSLLMLALLGGGGAYLVYLAITKRLGRNRVTILIGFLFLAGVASLFSVPRVSDVVVGQHEYLSRVSAFTKLEAAQNAQQQAVPTGEGGQTPSAADTSGTTTTQVQTTPESTKQARALSQLLTNNVIRQEATKFDVDVSGKEVNELYKQYVEQAGGESQLKDRIKEVLGWSPSVFKRELRVQLLQQKLREKLQTDDELNKDQKAKADDFLKRAKAGEDFAGLAKQSDDPTAQAGGDQGVVKRGELSTEVEGPAFSLQPGQVSDVIKTNAGYVIIKVEAKPSADQVQLRQILVRTTSLTDFIPAQLKDTKVAVYVRALYWDTNLYAIQPKDQAQQNADQSTPAASPGVTPAPASPAAQ